METRHPSDLGLARYSDSSDATAKPGLVRGDAVFDLVAAVEKLAGGHPSLTTPEAAEWRHRPADLEQFLALAGWRDIVEAVAEGLDEEDGHEGADLSDVEFLAPVRAPEKIVAVGLNYSTHIAEAGRDTPEYPMLFAKYANTLTGAASDVPIPKASHRIDYEGELAVIIGTSASAVPAEEAMSVVAGFAVANDVSARDYQFRTRQILQGKTFDKFCPLGPWIRLRRPDQDLSELELRTDVNGEPRQRALIGDLFFDVPFLIEYLSNIMTLAPGDVILTGTPGGIGAAMDPRRWLRDGDVVTIEIDQVGRLENRFVTSS